MADPFSITSVVALGLQSINQLLALINDFRDAPRAIQQISEESRSILNVLSGLDQFIYKNGESQIFGEDRESLKAPLNLTRSTANQLAHKIMPLLVKADGSWIAKSALKSAKGTLDTSMSSLNVTTTFHVKKDMTEVKNGQIVTNDGISEIKKLVKDIRVPSRISLNLGRDRNSKPSGVDVCHLIAKRVGSTTEKGLESVYSELSPLHQAAFTGNVEAVSQLLESGVDIEAKDADSFSALHYACMHADLTFMGRLLGSCGPDFEAFYDLSKYRLPADLPNSDVCKCRTQIVEMLLAHPADVNARKNGITPLYIATVTAQETLATMLLSKGAKATGIPVVTAYWGLSSKTVKLLLDQGASVSATDSRWAKPALTWTAEVGTVDMLRVLLDHGADVNHQDRQGSSALHYAAANARSEIVTLLLDADANPNLTDMFGSSPLIRLAMGRPYYLAGKSWNPSSKDREEATASLLAAGCDSSRRDIRGNLAAHYAAENGHLGVLKAIESAGGDMGLGSGSGKTTLMWAKENGHLEVIKYLKKMMREHLKPR
ncbi:MAG: hypothetical protein Q9214_002710 [Letrouitia sp. 1 TL-2023]